jgi:AcrR family transcriptional regulator
MIRKLNPEKRDRFLSSALKLFVAKGVQNTSTAAIAKEAGTAAGTLFLYFPTKQDLIDELVLNVIREQSKTIQSKLEPTLSARETFLTIWDGTIRWFTDNMEVYKYIQQVRDSGVISEAVIQESNESFDYYYVAIQKGLAENSIMPYPIELIGEMLYREIIAVMNLISTQPDPEKQEEYIRLGFDIFWNGVKNTDD